MNGHIRASNNVLGREKRRNDIHRVAEIHNLGRPCCNLGGRGLELLPTKRPSSTCGVPVYISPEYTVYPEWKSLYYFFFRPPRPLENQAPGSVIDKYIRAAVTCIQRARAGLLFLLFSVVLLAFGRVADQIQYMYHLLPTRQNAASYSSKEIL